MHTVDCSFAALPKLLSAPRRPESGPLFFEFLPNGRITLNGISRESYPSLFWLTEGHWEFQAKLLPSISARFSEVLESRHQHGAGTTRSCPLTLNATRKSSRYTLSVLGGGRRGELVPFAPSTGCNDLGRVAGFSKERKYFTAPAVSPVVYKSRPKRRETMAREEMVEISST